MSGDFPWEYRAFRVRVGAVRQLSPGFVRITLTGDTLRYFAPWGLDQRIKLVLPMPDGSTPDFGLLDEPTPHPRDWYTRWKALPEDRRNVLRTYTPSAIRPEVGEIDVDLYLHEPAGPASRWARTARPGDDLVITGPEVRVGHSGYGIHYVPPAPPEHLLLIGDESALPAMADILAAHPDLPGDVLLEVADPADDLLSGGAHRARVHRVRRGAVAGCALERAVHDWAADHAVLTADPGLYAWIAGEAAATTAVRRHLTGTRGVAKERVAFLGYWKLGGPLVG